ncbi:MAG: GNAT family N-acetyltransferase [Bacteroidota bacterium]
MQNNINKNKEIDQFAYSILINVYMRETGVWSRYYHRPQYDAAIADLFDKTGFDKWIKLPLEESKQEIFCPIKRYTESGHHEFLFPIFSRNNESDFVKPITWQEFLLLIHTELSKQVKHAVSLPYQEFLGRVSNSVDNIKELIAQREELGLTDINEPLQRFIESEQSLVLGHAMHPFGKGRMGWQPDQLKTYSPETQQGFELCYFLADPSILSCTDSYFAVAKQVRSNLMQCGTLPEDVLNALNDSPERLLLPIHPWEAHYLMEKEETKALIDTGKLIFLGQIGKKYQATSSVRTVYCDTEPFMFKFSLHVKITNSERVNAQAELERGYRFHKLLQTEWGDKLKASHPHFSTIDDPAYFQILHDGSPISGFNTIIRQNPFMKDEGDKNVSLIASLCQDGIGDKPSRMHRILTEFGELHSTSTKIAALEWFSKYLDLLLGNLTNIFSEFGLVLEAHQQNILVNLDYDGSPNHLYYRDNQGYFFWTGASDFICSFMPELVDKEWTFFPEEVIYPKYTYYLMVNNVLGVVSAMTKTGFIDERDLLVELRTKLLKFQEIDQTGLISYILDSRDWTIKANMLTKLADMDEVLQPMDNPAIYCDMPNPLMILQFQEEYMKPKHSNSTHECYFEDLDITVKLRPFNVKEDIPLVHKWFNEEHTKSFWKMDGPIKELEKFYIELEESEASTAYIGEIDGEPTFTFEPYWPMRDDIGRYYDALPSDHGAHLLIAPTDKNKKYTFHSVRAFMMQYFQIEGTGKMIGEADVNMRPMHILVTRIGFKLQKVVELPHKKANLTFCTREDYLERFPNDNVYPMQLCEQIQ